MSPHKVDNHGDFLKCKVPTCRWSATWSMGHICDHCSLRNCTCPCPLTAQWLTEHAEELAFRKIKEYLAHEKASEGWYIQHQKEKGERLAGKFYHQTLGRLELISDLYRIVPLLEPIKKEKQNVQNN